MAGKYVSLTQDFVDEDDCRDYRYDPIGVPMEKDDRKGKFVIMGQTHGCSCCSSDDILTVNDLKEHIQALKEDLEKAEQALVILENMRGRKYNG